MLGCADSAEEHVVERASILLSPEGGASKRTVIPPGKPRSRRRKRTTHLPLRRVGSPI